MSLMPCSWVHFCLSISIYESVCVFLFWLCFSAFSLYLSLLPTPLLFFSISPRPCLSLLRGRKHVPHATCLSCSPFRMAVFPFNKLLPVSKWLVLSPLQSEGTGTGCDECEEVFIMNRISLLFTQTLWRHREGKQTILQLNVIKYGGVSRKVVWGLSYRMRGAGSHDWHTGDMATHSRIAWESLGFWWATVHSVAESQTWLKRF